MVDWESDIVSVTLQEREERGGREGKRGNSRSEKKDREDEREGFGRGLLEAGSGGTIVK
jgi:hypothetical protein